jgi:integrase
MVSLCANMYLTLYLAWGHIMATDHLWRRGNQWYLRVAIPRPLRHLFLSSSGKPMVRVVERLSDSREVAKVMAAERVAVCMRVFARIKAGLLTTPEQVADAMHPGEPDIALEPGFDEAMRRYLASPELRKAEFERYRRTELERRVRVFEEYAASTRDGERPASTTGETITQAAEAWFKELKRDKSPRDTTLGGHRLRVRAFVEKSGDLPLTEVTRAMARDFLDGLNVKARTRNNYADTLKYIFKSAGRRGRFSNAEEDNPFDDQRSKPAGSSYQPFAVAELQTLFDSMPRDVKPKKHTPDTALPWVALMALYTGARLEEIAQLTTADVRDEGANGARVWCIDVHNGGDNKLKNESAARLIPVHSELVRLGLLDYVKALPKGALFPGLRRRESKGGKIGARVGELFRKRLVALGLKRDGLCFHSFRHTVATALRVATPSVPQEDAARVLGHAVVGMSYGTYAQAGPGLKRVAAVVEQIAYEGLRI